MISVNQALNTPKMRSVYHQLNLHDMSAVEFALLAIAIHECVTPEVAIQIVEGAFDTATTGFLMRPIPFPIRGRRGRVREQLVSAISKCFLRHLSLKETQKYLGRPVLPQGRVVMDGEAEHGGALYPLSQGRQLWRKIFNQHLKWKHSSMEMNHDEIVVLKFESTFKLPEDCPVSGFIVNDNPDRCNKCCLDTVAGVREWWWSRVRTAYRLKCKANSWGQTEKGDRKI